MCRGLHAGNVHRWKYVDDRRKCLRDRCGGRDNAIAVRDGLSVPEDVCYEAPPQRIWLLGVLAEHLWHAAALCVCLALAAAIGVAIAAAIGVAIAAAIGIAIDAAIGIALDAALGVAIATALCVAIAAALGVAIAAATSSAGTDGVRLRRFGRPGV